MKNRIRTALAITALTLAYGSAGASDMATAADRCAEDEPCWNWATMGNQERGVFVHGKRARVIVNPCRFAYLSHEGRIDTDRTPRLRGDRLAERHGCDYRYFG